MTMLDLLRGGTSIVWALLLISLAKPAWRVFTGKHDIRPTEAVMAAVWLLCVNRETFTYVSWVSPGDTDALNVCYAFALFAGLNMLFACSWARRISKRRDR